MVSLGDSNKERNEVVVPHVTDQKIRPRELWYIFYGRPVSFFAHVFDNITIEPSNYFDYC